MGFWNSLMSEAGAKTGKAIGNKLFGRYGADEVVNFNHGQTLQEQQQQSLLSQLLDSEDRKDKMIEKERTHKKEDIILEMNFDSSNPQYNYQLLFQLIAMIDTWIKDEDNTKLYSLARSKFDAGLLMCQIIDADNPNIGLLSQKQQMWDNYLLDEKNKKEAAQKKNKKNSIITAIIMLAILGGIFSLPFILGY